MAIADTTIGVNKRRIFRIARKESSNPNRFENSTGNKMINPKPKTNETSADILAV